MAELKKTVLGKVSGAVGDIVFRERDGKNYIGLRPDSFVPGTDPASVARRQRFLLSLKAGSSINSVAQFKSLWTEVTPSGLSPFNYIVKTNYRYVTSTSITDLLQLVPGGGFGVAISASSVDRTNVRVVVDPIGSNTGIDPIIEPNIVSAGVIFLSSPIDESVDLYSILTVVSSAQVTSLTEQLRFDAFLTNQQQVLFDKYQVRKTFVALVTLDASSAPVHHSSTILLS